MDLLKTLMIYMMIVLSSATEANPGVTAPPATPTPAPTPYVSPAPSEVPTDAPTAAATEKPVSYSTLSRGSTGDDVRALQQALVDLGYLNDTVDGAFGAKTKKAVEAFQKEMGLKVDGIAGRDTLTALYALLDAATPAP